jgi:hypothetical protein
MWTTMTMTGGVDGASLKIGAKSFTEEALLAAITKIELGNLKYDIDFRSVYQTHAIDGAPPEALPPEVLAQPGAGLVDQADRRQASAVPDTSSIYEAGRTPLLSNM